MLSSSNAGVIQQSLQLGLARAMTCDVVAAARLLEDLILDSKELRHCVRCHNDYFENENSPSACQMEHLEVDNSTWERIVPEHAVYRGRLECCGQWEYPDGHPLHMDFNEVTYLCAKAWHAPYYSEIQGDCNFQRTKEKCNACNDDAYGRCVKTSSIITIIMIQKRVSFSPFGTARHTTRSMPIHRFPSLLLPQSAP